MNNTIKKKDNFKKKILNSISFFSMLILIFFLYQRYFILNLTNSMPIGLYLKTYPMILKNNDFVLFCLEGEVAKWAATNYIIPHGIGCNNPNMPLIKKIIAIQGNHVLLTHSGFSVNGILIKNTMPNLDQIKQWFPLNKHIILKHDEFIVISTKNMLSFDSRYFGIIHRYQIIAKVIPIWTYH